jgi:hypothetical protein
VMPQEFAAWHIGTFPPERPPETTVAHWLDRESGYAYIGRSMGDGFFGNPFVLGRDGNRAEVLGKYRGYFEDRLTWDPYFKARVHRLRGYQLVCHCKPLDCHGDIIADYLNSL